MTDVLFFNVYLIFDSYICYSVVSRGFIDVCYTRFAKVNTSTETDEVSYFSLFCTCFCCGDPFTIVCCFPASYFFKD